MRSRWECGGWSGAVWRKTSGPACKPPAMPGCGAVRPTPVSGLLDDGKVKEIAVAGGAAQSLCDAFRGVGGAWNRDGTIVFGVRAGGLQRVPAEGGVPARVSREEAGPRFPAFLPDGRQFLYFVPSRFPTPALPAGIFPALP